MPLTRRGTLLVRAPSRPAEPTDRRGVSTRRNAGKRLLGTPSVREQVPLCRALTPRGSYRDGQACAIGSDPPRCRARTHSRDSCRNHDGTISIGQNEDAARPLIAKTWPIQLIAAVVVLRIALSLHLPTAERLIAQDATRHIASSFSQSLYAWLCVFGLMGLSQTIPGSQRPAIRYLSDASYWLYLAHLPLIIVGQRLIRDAPLPPAAKVIALVAISTAILFVAYRCCIRYTPVGTMLNGKRHRPTRAAQPGKA